MDYNDTPSYGSHIDRTADAVAPTEPHLPEFAPKMLYMGHTDPFQPNRLNPLRKAKKCRLYVIRQSSDLGIYNRPQGLHGPSHEIDPPAT